MDALLSAFLAALISEQGDASQLVALGAVARFGATKRVAAALFAAALLNAALAAGFGAGVRVFLPFRGALLLTALALLAAAAGMAFAAGTPRVRLYPRLGAAGATLLAAAVQGFGDRTQFLVFALAARSDTPLLAAVGGGAGACLGLVPVLALGAGFDRAWPVHLLRRIGAGLFAVAGLWLLVASLRLI